MKNLAILLAFLFVLNGIAQESKKVYQTNFVEYAPKIDGILDDDAWKNAEIATNFVMLTPGTGTPEPKNLKSEVKVVYDNEAIYFAAFLHDDKPHEIPMEFQTRDNFGNADFFGVVINPQNDGINQTEFFVMSTGNQNDAKASNGKEDFSWNSVWYSKVSLVDDGWIVEMKIPYSSLRFSNEPIQTWGVNFHRKHAKTRDQYSWNYVPKDKGNIAQFDGLLKGIKNIEPPIRLSLSPYVSSSLDGYKGETDFGWSAGMDLKYGLSESFTLDATLIPDFGQTAYDEQVLNLSPFETKYSEKRQFFTEGLDLFSKGNLFYSRRIGDTPIGKYSIVINENETIIDNPDSVDMLNAIKISGRTQNGLGIGFFNAITKKTKASIENKIDGSIREVVTEPLANYNLLVLDKQFNKNSSVTLINSHVIREGHFRDADVLGFLYDVKTKNSKYGVEGGIVMSNIIDGNWTTGFEGNIELGKISGNHQYELEVNFQDEKYSKNDMGYQRSNNNMSIETEYSYRIFEPQGIFNNYGIYLWSDINFLYKVNEETISFQNKKNSYTGSYVGISAWATTKKQLSFGGNLNFGIGPKYDYYEPRVKGRFYKKNPNRSVNMWLSSDFRKKLALSSGIYIANKSKDSETYLSFNIAPRYRVNNHILLQYNINVWQSRNNKGFVKVDDGNIIFGNRDVSTIINTFSAKYNFSTKSSLGLNFRHYLSTVKYKNLAYLLNSNGDLSTYAYSDFKNINSNIWNLDINYSWEFAPGSQLSILYRNSIYKTDNDTDLSFINNIDMLFKDPLKNQVSFKLIYYLDYNKVKNWI